MKYIFILVCMLSICIQSCDKGDKITEPENIVYSDYNWVKIATISLPPERAYHDMAYDSESDRVILFGGDSGPAALRMYSDTWAYDHDSKKWTNMKPSGGPAAGHAMTYDVESDRIILFGSSSRGTLYGSDTWAYDFNSNNWTELKPAQKPPGRFGHNMAYDAESDRIILFGGSISELQPIDDTWSYDFNTNTWTEMNPPASPPPRQYHSMAYDLESDQIILFGGGDYTPESMPEYTIIYDDTWAYDFNSNTWTQMMPDKYPSARVYTDMTYNEKCDCVILFGGGTGSFKEAYPSRGYGNETWQYDFNSNEWRKINIEKRPSSRKKHKLAYDSESDRIILFGGDEWYLDGNTSRYQNELWVLEK
ncbi:hypothetical protein JXJ21_25010 [candidate division KSB1 bacterium]|nr:hypothetical protein [candidate division KSB1 bacterium]